MESLVQWFSIHGQHAHYILFGLLLLAGFSLPISEEVMLMIGGILASSFIPERTIHLFFGVFLGCYFSDWIAYWLGRFLGYRLYSVRWLHFALCEKRVAKLNRFFASYGFLTLVIGRFIPFGVRNGIFMTAGIGKMHFGKFALIDILGCFCFSLLLFSLAYYCGANYEALAGTIKKGKVILFILFVLTVCAIGVVLWIKKRHSKQKTLA
jgi:membrane-associated protein